MITGINESNKLTKHISRKSKCKLPSWHAIFWDYSVSVPSALQCSGHPEKI